MHDLFFRRFNEKVALTPEEEDFIKQYLTYKKLRKKQYLLQEGDVCKSLAFIEKGALRSYILDSKGLEHTIYFGLEGWTMGDLHSFIKEEPASYNIDALEASELTLITKPAYEALLQQMPKYETYMRLLMTDAYMVLQKRTGIIISLPLEEQYQLFIQSFPNIVQRVPQHMIASYLGVSAETLSRLRGKMNHQK